MKVAVAQRNYHIGNFSANQDQIIQSIEQAKTENTDLIVFAELAICGYPPRDFLEFDHFIELCEEAIDTIAKHANGIAVILGGPARNTSPQGKKLFNAAYFLADGKIQSIHHKTLLPTYDVFDEYRYFEPSGLPNIITLKGKKIALTICEDIWDLEDHELYVRRPLEKLAQHNPDLIVNIAASPYSFNHAEERLKILKRNVEKFELPLIYVNHVGAQTELVFDGGSLALHKNGNVAHQLAFFEEDFKTFELADLCDAKATIAETPLPSKMQSIHDALVLGVRDYFTKLGFKQAVLGLSGGIDSAVTLAITAKALGPENVHAILLPSQYSSDHSVSDSEQMVANLGCPSQLIPIKDAYGQFEQLLAPSFEGKPFDVTEENLQARIRGVLLMALSNKFGYILLNTSNKSEAAVGYGTLYGDMCGGLSVIGDVYKTEVFELARYINRDGEIIPENIITKPPSAELRPDQKDSDSLPDYSILDAILYNYIEGRKSPGEIIALGFDAATVNKVLRLVNINEYKRFQTPPVLRVSEKAFGMGRRLPIVARFLS